MNKKETNLSLFENFETKNEELLSKENSDEEIVEAEKEKRSTLFTILNGEKVNFTIEEIFDCKNTSQ